MINNITYIFLTFFSFALACIPRKIVLYFGKIVGLILYYIFPIRKKVAFKNLEIVYPLKTKREINKIILKSYMHYGLISFEFIRNVFKQVSSSDFIIDEKSKNILRKKTGLIFMTAHIGNWEMLLPIVNRYKKMLAVFREQNNSGGDKFFRKARTYDNITLISKKGSKRLMLESLYENCALALASDQNAKDKGVYVDFFGKKASFPKGAGHFFYKTKAEIAVGFCILDNDYKYNLDIKYISLENINEQKDNLIVKINEIYAKHLEKEIIKYPEQYFWFHKKWDKRIYDL